MIKPISISLSPNTERDDIWAAFFLMFQPWRWSRGRAIKKFEQVFAEYHKVESAFSFNSGRSSFLALLDAYELEKGDEVLIQAFTCNAVPNPVIWSKLKPVYVDCGEDYNMDAKDLERKITPRSKMVVVQHTFGIPADIDTIQDICRKHNLILVEDCAHALGSKYKGDLVGTLGDAAFFSFSRDKVISSVYGGMAVTNNVDVAKKLLQYQEKTEYPSLFWTKQQLAHPLLMNWLVLPTYSIFGKYMLLIFQWLRILSKAVHWKEKQGMKPAYFPKRLPNALAILALRQFYKLDRFQEHRKKTIKTYREELSLEMNTEAALRLPVRHKNAHRIIRKAWKKNILIGDWYTTPVAPYDTDLDKVYYKKGSCPQAEQLADSTFNLPTHIQIGDKEIQKIVEFVKEYAD